MNFPLINFTMYLMQTLISAFLFFLPLLPASDTAEYIDWGKERRLSWTDFEGAVDKTSDAAASTSTFLGFNYHIHNNTFSYQIACKFSKKKSWGLVKNNWILKHEQGHFDISEIFARRLYEAVENYQPKHRSLKKDLDKIYQQVMQEKEDFQIKYDTETDFSRNKEVQREWLDKIDSLLDETKDLANYTNPDSKRISE
jgi:Predicted secreted Zn-dependent protease